ncbi:glycine-rich RNA-binding protein 3, mitochondrial isoform X2 [Eurytemora carolleeae]|uniref:glycine-rich RNA-binding protein 3, mitochondrial isoform X2 n=1 Tax=Eurytemora carolleeae TaxID=1294199 RepID=UPI000C76F618|nr:glycine-rich RNA-binding protein 3, mitochondrial isoform X2 [Eurytemora carolleeae]|eukprot:XP_023345674.1 glycine-rich RNA-binding protein 3, mitochondrial-like isoform X2 [Eurytemora affinis]
MGLWNTVQCTIHTSDVMNLKMIIIFVFIVQATGLPLNCAEDGEKYVQFSWKGSCVCEADNLKMYGNQIDLESGSLIGSKPDCIEYCKELEGCEYITQNKHTQECFFSTGKGPVNVTEDKGFTSFHKDCNSAESTVVGSDYQGNEYPDDDNSDDTVVGSDYQGYGYDDDGGYGYQEEGGDDDNVRGNGDGGYGYDNGNDVNDQGDTYYEGEADEGDGGDGAAVEEGGDGGGGAAYDEAEGDDGAEYDDNAYEDSYDEGGEVNREYGNNGQYNNPFLDSSENGAAEGEADTYDAESGYYYEYY